MTTKTLRNRVQNEAYYLVLWQLVGVLVLALAAYLIVGRQSGLSVLAGGLVYCLPNLFFVWRVFRYVGAQQMTQFVAAFTMGEMLKLFLSGILFILVVNTLPVSLLSVLVGYIGAMVSFWIVCMWYFSRPVHQPKI